MAAFAETLEMGLETNGAFADLSVGFASGFFNLGAIICSFTGNFFATTVGFGFVFFAGAAMAFFFFDGALATTFGTTAFFLEFVSNDFREDFFAGEVAVVF